MPRKKTKDFPVVNTGAGTYSIPGAWALIDDEQLCVQLADVEMPSFETIAKEQFEKASACSGFFPSGVNQLTRKIVAECERYTHEVDEAAERLKHELSTTHKTSIESALEVCGARLRELGVQIPQQEAASPDANSCRAE